MDVPPIAHVEPPLGFDPILGGGQSMFVVFFTEKVGFNVIVTSEEARKAGFAEGAPTVEWLRERVTRYVTERLNDDRPALEQMGEWPSPILLTAD